MPCVRIELSKKANSLKKKVPKLDEFAETPIKKEGG